MARTLGVLAPTVSLHLVLGSRAQVAALHFSYSSVCLFLLFCRILHRMQDQITPFDLNRMFLGTETSWLFLAEVAVRTTILFVWALFNVRLLGKRNLGQLSPFQLLITIALGSAVGDPMFYHDVPILPAMLAISIVIWLEKLLSWLSLKSEAVEQWVEGRAVVVIENGKLCTETMKEHSVPEDELFARLREQGVEYVGQVKKAYLERSGNLGVIQFSKTKEKGEQTTQLPEEKSLVTEITKLLSFK